MPSQLEVDRKLWHDAFVGSGYQCVYCEKDLLGSLDDFAAAHLDHLKPVKTGGSHDRANRVVACSVCNSIKGSFDPAPGELITEENFGDALRTAREYVREKREGERECSYVRDYHYWLRESGRFR